MRNRLTVRAELIALGREHRRVEAPLSARESGNWRCARDGEHEATADLRNGIQHLERGGRKLNRVRAVIFCLLSRHGPDALFKVEFRALDACYFLASLSCEKQQLDQRAERPFDGLASPPQPPQLVIG
jgi:hypothetical protein